MRPKSTCSVLAAIGLTGRVFTSVIFQNNNRRAAHVTAVIIIGASLALIIVGLIKVARRCRAPGDVPGPSSEVDVDR